MSFKDYFSRRAQGYAQRRPSHPSELFAYLAALSPSRRLAWDCGTGNGQAALGLAGLFDRVVATDASADQLAYALRHKRIEYRLEPAEQVSLEHGGVALVIVAHTVSVGTTVAWHNAGIHSHTVTAQGGAWNSGLVLPTGMYEHTFDTPGTYTYVCTSSLDG